MTTYKVIEANENSKRQETHEIVVSKMPVIDIENPTIANTLAINMANSNASSSINNAFASANLTREDFPSSYRFSSSENPLTTKKSLNRVEILTNLLYRKSNQPVVVEKQPTKDYYDDEYYDYFEDENITKLANPSNFNSNSPKANNEISRSKSPQSSFGSDTDPSQASASHNGIQAPAQHTGPSPSDEYEEYYNEAYYEDYETTTTHSSTTTEPFATEPTITAPTSITPEAGISF